MQQSAIDHSICDWGSSGEDVAQQKFERLVEIDVRHAITARALDPRWLKYREFGKALAPEARGGGRHWQDPWEKTDAPVAALRQADHDIDLAAVDDIGAVLGAADRGECRRRYPRTRLPGAQGRHGDEIGDQRFEMIALQCRHMVGLGRGKQHAIYTCAKQEAQRTASAETERLEDRLQRQALIGEGLFAGVERAQHIDKND